MKKSKTKNSKTAEKFLKWFTFTVALCGLGLGILNYKQNIDIQKIEKALKVEELIGQANDFIYFSKSDNYKNVSIPPRQLELAGRKISEVLIIDPDNVEALKLAGIYSIEKGLIEDSIRQLKKAIKLDPTITGLYLLLGKAYSEQNKYEDAIKEFKNAINADSTMTAAHSALGACFYQLKMYKEAIQAFEKAVKLEPEASETHYTLGYIYYFQGRLEKAKEELCRVIKIDSNYSNVNELMARIMYFQGKIKSVSEYDKTIACNLLPTPVITTPFYVIEAKKNEITGQIEAMPMWKNPSTGELKPIGEWWE